ncbi:MAG: rod shape-determining protein RodA [Candidatus Dependentiae bacterium]|nr:rod shape-determining protein RodA [Candidatus Dependentiae bacterium]
MKKRLIFDIDRRLVYHGDWLNLILVLILSAIGLLSIFSATYPSPQPVSGSVAMQAFGIASGTIIYLLIFFTNRRVLTLWGTIFYYVTLVLLAFTLVKGSVGMWGGQRWISLGFVRFQPSELAKLFFPAFFVTTLGLEEGKRPTQWAYFRVLSIMLVSVLLILKQPDLGTALILLFSGILLLWLSRIGRVFFTGLTIICALGAPIAWKLLKPYQKQRVIVYLGGGQEQKERYQIEQAKIAVGSGGIWGKGFLQGTQSHLHFLPASKTDFIFALICEETGLVGALTVILLFVILFLRALLSVSRIREPSQQLLAIGLITPTILSTIINICMVLGLMPIVGIPLPFITYGSTHLWIEFAAMGWYNNIVARSGRAESGSFEPLW